MGMEEMCSRQGSFDRARGRCRGLAQLHSYVRASVERSAERYWSSVDHQQRSRYEEAGWQGAHGAELRVDHGWLRDLASSGKSFHQAASNGHARGQLHGLAHQRGGGEDILCFARLCKAGEYMEYWF